MFPTMDLIQFSDSEDDDEQLSASSSAFDFGINWRPGFFGAIGSRLPTSPSALSSSSSFFASSIPSPVKPIACLPPARQVRAISHDNQSSTGRLHVSNIPFRFRREHLVDMFSKFGRVLDAEIIFNERGSKGFGFISFDRPEDATKAKQYYHGAIIEGRQIEVNHATPRPQRWTTKKSAQPCLMQGFRLHNPIQRSAKMN